MEAGELSVKKIEERDGVSANAVQVSHGVYMKPYVW
jgi:hypothetical protein